MSSSSGKNTRSFFFESSGRAALSDPSRFDFADDDAEAAAFGVFFSSFLPAPPLLGGVASFFLSPALGVSVVAPLAEAPSPFSAADTCTAAAAGGIWCCCSSGIEFASVVSGVAAEGSSAAAETADDTDEGSSEAVGAATTSAGGLSAMASVLSSVPATAEAAGAAGGRF